MHQILLRLKNLTILLFFLILQLSCSSSVSNIELKDSYDFSSNRTVTTYVVPSGNLTLDNAYARVLQLDLQSRGYKIKNASRELLNQSDLSILDNHQQIADSIAKNEILQKSDAIVVAQPKWDSVFFASELGKTLGNDIYRGMEVLRLSSEVTFYDSKLQNPIKSFNALDTTRIYTEIGDDTFVYPEFPWMVVARQLTKGLKDIPICSNVNTFPAAKQFRIKVWVDKSYREKFSHKWKERLKLRFLYANDVLYSQFGIKLVITEFKEWDTHFNNSLEQCLSRLERESSHDQKFLNIGVTLNKRLKTNWTEKSELGFAILIGLDAVITAQPSFPGLGLWNPIEESITIVNEMGHLFGALHVKDENSIMYSTSGSLSSEFDEINTKIIKAMVNIFFESDNYQCIRNYVQALVDLRETSFKNAIPVLAPIAIAVVNKKFNSSIVYPRPERLEPEFSKFVSDSLHRLAAMDYVEYKLGRYKQAQELFLNAIELDSEFAEVHWYLSLLYKNIGNKTEAEKHNKLAKPYKGLWVLDKK